MASKEKELRTLEANKMQDAINEQIVENAKLQKALDEKDIEIMKLKAKLYDMMNA